MAFLDGTSGPAGRMGESLLWMDLLLNLVVLAPVLLLLPAVLCPPFFHMLHYIKREENNAVRGNSETAARRREVKRRSWIVRALAVAGAAVASVFVLKMLTFIFPLELSPTAISQKDAVSVIGEKNTSGFEGEDLALLPIAADEQLQLRSPKVAHFGSLLGLLSLGFGHYLLPSPAFPFSPVRPLQLHFVIFRRSKVTALPCRPCRSGTKDVSTGEENGIEAPNDNSSCAKVEQLEVEAGTTASAAGEAAKSAFNFPSELELLSSTHRTSHFVRHSTQGVAVLGLGRQVFWNPAASDASLVLSVVRRAIENAEQETGAYSSKVTQTVCVPPADTANTIHQSSGGAALVEELSGEAASETTKDTADMRCSCTVSSRSDKTRQIHSPSFHTVEESPSPKAPLTRTHLHWLSTIRTHWSVYTNGKVISWKDL